MANLPTFLGSAANAPQKSQGSTHAQNFSTTKLTQHKEREAARVSMHQATATQKKSRASTSIAHILDGSSNTDHAPLGAYSDEEQEEIRTRLRYQHIRKLMKEKKQQSKTS